MRSVRYDIEQTSAREHSGHYKCREGQETNGNIQESDKMDHVVVVSCLVSPNGLAGIQSNGAFA